MPVSWFLPFIWLIHFILCSHVFGTVSDQSDLDNSQICADENDIEDEFETVRRQCAEKRVRIASQRRGIVSSQGFYPLVDDSAMGVV